MSPNTILGRTPAEGVVGAFKSPVTDPISNPPIEPEDALTEPENDPVAADKFPAKLASPDELIAKVVFVPLYAVNPAEFNKTYEPVVGAVSFVFDILNVPGVTNIPFDVMFVI